MFSMDDHSQTAPVLPIGRLVEISDARHLPSARSTTAAIALAQAQATERQCAWLRFAGDSLYPPDLALNGVDLSRLAVVQTPTREGAFGLVRAAELLLAANAFGLLVIDLSIQDNNTLQNIIYPPMPNNPSSLRSSSDGDMLGGRAGPMAGFAARVAEELSGTAVWQKRLSRLARDNAATVLLLTSERASRCSLGPFITLHIAASWHAPDILHGASPKASDKQLGRRPQMPPRRSGEQAVLHLEYRKNKLGLPQQAPIDIRLPDGAPIFIRNQVSAYRLASEKNHSVTGNPMGPDSVLALQIA